MPSVLPVSSTAPTSPAWVRQHAGQRRTGGRRRSARQRRRDIGRQRRARRADVADLDGQHRAARRRLGRDHHQPRGQRRKARWPRRLVVGPVDRHFATRCQPAGCQRLGPAAGERLRAWGQHVAVQLERRGQRQRAVGGELQKLGIGGIGQHVDGSADRPGRSGKIVAQAARKKCGEVHSIIPATIAAMPNAASAAAVTRFSHNK